MGSLEQGQAVLGAQFILLGSLALRAETLRDGEHRRDGDSVKGGAECEAGDYETAL